MNQVWLFFKLIEVVLGSLCMFFHVQGSMYWAEPIPHVLVYCATFVSYTMMAALGAFRLLLTRSSVLSSQLLLTLSAVIFHYFCGILVMRTALRTPIWPPSTPASSTWSTRTSHTASSRASRQ